MNKSLPLQLIIVYMNIQQTMIMNYAKVLATLENIGGNISSIIEEDTEAALPKHDVAYSTDHTEGEDNHE